MQLENEDYIYEFGGLSDSFDQDELLFTLIKNKNETNYSIQINSADIKKDYDFSEQDFIKYIKKLCESNIQIKGKKTDYHIKINYLLFFERNEKTYNIALNKLAVHYLEKARDYNNFLETKKILNAKLGLYFF